MSDEDLLLFFLETDASPKPLTIGNPDYEMILLAYYSFIFLALTLGSKLIRESELWAKSVGVKRIWFYVVADNISAINLYLKLGYRFEGLRRDSYLLDGKFTDEYIMAKIL